jgi:selenium-binding protein 1
VLEVRPAHDPSKTWGFTGVVIIVEDLSGSVWAWYRDGERWAARKVITVPAEPADPDLLPPALKPFGAVPLMVAIGRVRVAAARARLTGRRRSPAAAKRPGPGRR